MEPRRLLAGDSLRLGAVFIEEDLGSDEQGDRFEITFEGGAADTELTRLVINGDQDEPGFGKGDVFFDTDASGYGADRAFPFTLVALTTRDPNATVRERVLDGGSQLVLELTRFQAGDKLVFSIDVDEVEDFSGSVTDLELVNDGFDPITSGVEFQNSTLTAEFTAPHYHDISGEAVFVNRYDNLLAGTSLDLPLDDAQGKRDRTDGAVLRLQQQPIPVALSGTVYLDDNLDLQQQPEEAGLKDVILSLYELKDGQYVPTGHTTTTDEAGDYAFGFELGLMPSFYQVREMQPAGLVSVGAVAGTVNGNPAGETTADRDLLTSIEIPAGGLRAVDVDFAEARPAAISGYVYHDRSNEGQRDANEEGLAGVRLQIIPVTTIAPQASVGVITDASGFYQADGLMPGTYRIIEVEQPAGYFDGLDRPGTVNGTNRGVAESPGDAIEGIALFGGDAGVQYNFGEIAPASLSGRVHLSDPQGDCFALQATHQGIADVVIRLLDENGNLVAQTATARDGDYRFENLLPATYQIVEMTPAGLLDGAERLGEIAGQRRGTRLADDHLAVQLGSGEHAVAFDFCEHLPASVSGFVYHDANNNGTFDLAERPIEGAAVALQNDTGSVVAATQTDPQGHYRFEGLRAGIYSLVETQPVGWLDGQDAAGVVASETVGKAINPGDRIMEVQLNYGDRGEHYDFGELLPVKVGGFVYHDRDDDGLRDTGEEGLAGVAIQVIPEATMTPQDIVTVWTDQQGMYMAGGLSPGRYRIVEPGQPAGFLDGIDMAGRVTGETRGIAAHLGDRIDGVWLASGEQGVEYNFGEVAPASIAGRVHLSDRQGDCDGDRHSLSGVANVEILLEDAEGTVIRRTRTDLDGRYRFEELRPGSYSVIERTPLNLLDGADHVGTIAGRRVGETLSDDRIQGVELRGGEQAQDYDFCENEPAEVSGFVYHDRNNNARREAGESPIAEVEMLLLDATGSVVEQTRTDERGFYEFTGLPGGTYSILEVQPMGWNDGLDTPGTVDGRATGQAGNPGDRLMEIDLGFGEQGIHYNFGELLPASVQGVVHTDLNQNCRIDSNEARLAGVVVELLDESGGIAAVSTTGADGEYHFDDLLPGTYQIRERQPAAYFHGGERVGSGGGIRLADDLIEFSIASGQALVDYDFCERPASRLTGFVFQDGPTLITEQGVAPEDLGLHRDGKRTPDDTPIKGVVLELRDGISGEAIDAGEALPGTYEPGPIRAATDAEGFYAFEGLPGGRNYAVYQVHPEGFVDGIDTPGTTSGVAINPADNVPHFLIARMFDVPANDAIILIPLGVGQASVENNFSEVRVEARHTFLLPPPPPPPAPLPPIAVPPLAPTLQLAPPSIRETAAIPLYGSGAVATTWHLSVINAGRPRGNQTAGEVDLYQWRQATYLESTNWEAARLAHATWTIVAHTADDEEANENAVIIFGIRDGIPVVGDFNGDGFAEVGVFFEGEWFLDLNRNGRWDSEDLWAELGSVTDLPAVGDWDGDGKDDIGIYGPKWALDDRAIRNEPGLPDALNRPHTRPKNVPPTAEESTGGYRLLRLNAEGPQRADVIDHVFRFGEAADQPVAGDFNGDGITSIGVFRDGQWRIDVDGDGRFTARDRVFVFGESGDRPLVGDFDGNGVDEIGIFRGGIWRIDSNHNFELDAHDRVFALGDDGDRPMVGDFNGDGTDDPALYREHGPEEPR